MKITINAMERDFDAKDERALNLRKGDAILVRLPNQVRSYEVGRVHRTLDSAGNLKLTVMTKGELPNKRDYPTDHSLNVWVQDPEKIFAIEDETAIDAFSSLGAAIRFHTKIKSIKSNTNKLRFVTTAQPTTGRSTSTKSISTRPARGQERASPSPAI